MGKNWICLGFSRDGEMVELTVESRWSKLCDTSGMISAVKCRSISFGTFCNQGLFPATRGWISSSVCKMLLHIGDAMAEWWNHHAAGGFAFFTFARCSACFSSSLTMAQPIESWCFWRLLIWVTFWVTQKTSHDRLKYQGLIPLAAGAFDQLGAAWFCFGSP